MTKTLCDFTCVDLSSSTTHLGLFRGCWSPDIVAGRTDHSLGAANGCREARISPPMNPNYVEAIADIIRGVWMVDLWGRMGWQDIKRRYRRTVFGPLWSSLSLAIFVTTLGFVWANLWKLDPKEYLPFLCSGMLVWVLFSAFIMEGCSIFVSHEGLIKQLGVSYTMLICAMIWRNLLVFAHNFIIYIPVYIYSRLPVTGYMLLAIPGLVVVSLNGAWIAMVLGLLCARFRDIQQVVASFLQVSMFVTPILWSPAQLSGRSRVLVDYNMLYHYVEIVRDPLLGKPPSSWSWFMVGLSTVLGWALALYMFSRFRRRIAYWL
jgi:ABC-type polysaccharide/polyol phosphate export permease